MLNQLFDQTLKASKAHMMQKSKRSVGVLFVLSVFFLVLDTSVSAQSSKANKAQPSVKKTTLPAKKNTNKTSNVLANQKDKSVLSDAAADEAASGEAEATSGPKVIGINVVGNKKIETDAVKSRLVTKEGSVYSAKRIRQDVEALFKSGFFYDIRVEKQAHATDVDLVYHLVEKPSVAEISFDGQEEIEESELKEASGLKAFEILNMSKIREATEKIQKLYEDKGFFLAKVNPKVSTVVEGESVKVTFSIEENEKVKVKQINFIGNRHLGDNRLKEMMQTKEGGFFAANFGGGAYKQDVFDRDVGLLGYMYFNEGYLQAKVDRPQIYVTPDKKGIYITIRIEEGERFEVGSVDFAGDLLFEREELFNTVEIDGSGFFKHETLLNDVKALQAKYGDLGYAYANPIPRTRIREADRKVDIIFEIEKGNKVYFNRINVIGNTKTRDKVIRRELKVREGELYNETRKRESLENVKRLGFFEDVNFNVSTPAENQDWMNVDIVVKERNTGSIQLGAGYSSESMFILNGRVEQTNFLGRGQNLGVTIESSRYSENYRFSFTEPYLYDSEWSGGVDVSLSKLEQTDVLIQKNQGFGLSIGHPLAPYLNGFIQYGYVDTNVELLPNGDPALFPSSGNGATSSSTISLRYDKRNDRWSPTKGIYAETSFQYAGLGGNKKYVKSVGIFRFYQKLFWEFVLRNNFNIGVINPNGSEDDALYNEKFYAGGPGPGLGVIRGYSSRSVTTTKKSQYKYNKYKAADTSMSDERAELLSQVPVGGKWLSVYNAEIEFPLIPEAGFKGVLFWDIGQASEELRSDGYRSGAGFGVRWFSPIGPLRFEWGFPVNRRETDEAYRFEFQIGSPF